MRLVKAFVVTAAFAAAAPGSSQNVPLSLMPGETLLEVEAEGVHRSRPDVMEISAGVVTTGSTASEALSANSALANRMVEAVRAQGLAATDIQTEELGVRPITDQNDERSAEREDRRPRIIGYTATNTVRLRLRELRSAPTLLDALLRAGANSVNGPAFSLSDKTQATRQARIDAVRRAREQAQTYAGAVGMRLGRILRMSERSRYTMNDNNQSITVTGSRSGLAPIEPGEIETEVRLWIDFTLLPR